MSDSSIAPAITAVGVRKSFGEQLVLDGVDLTVARGRIFALLGPNGAGKTTMVRILATLLEPDDGEIRIAGHDVAREADAVRAAIGVTGQFSAVDDLLTGRENLALMADLHHLPRAEGRARINELLERFDLVEAANRPVKTYSGGMRRRLDLAAALVAKPPVLFLDEPTTGLDPRSRLSLWETIEDLVSEGTTVLLTTQYLDEADRLADTIAVIDHGLLIARGTSDELKDRVGGERLEITLDDAADCQTAVTAIAPMSDEPPVFEGKVVKLSVRRRKGSIVEAARRLSEAGVGVDDMALRRPTLDDVFLGLTGHAAEEAAPDEAVEGDAGR
jgi:ABC-2 type transport system ATP-binding protein